MTTQVRMDADREVRRRIVREKFGMIDQLPAEGSRAGLSAAAVNLLSAVGRAARAFDDGWWCRISRAELGRKLGRHSGNVRKQLRRISALGAVTEGRFGPPPVFPIVEEVPIGIFRLRITHEREERGNTPLSFVITLGAPAPQPLGAPAPQPLGAPAPQPLGAPAPQGGHPLKGSAGAGARATAGIKAQVNTQAAAGGDAAAALAAHALEAIRRGKGHPELVALVHESDWSDLAAWLEQDESHPGLVPSALRHLVSFDKRLRKNGDAPVSNPPGYIRRCIENGWVQAKAAAKAETKLHADKATRAHNRPSDTRAEDARAKREADAAAQKAIREESAATIREGVVNIRRKMAVPAKSPAEEEAAAEARRASLRAMASVKS